MRSGIFRLPMPRFLRRLARSRAGVTAVEFALVGPIAIALVVGILETGIVFFYQQVLQTATTEAARLIMTGQAQNGNLGLAQFLADVCGDAGAMFNCSNLSANVQTFSSFQNMSQGNAFNSASNGFSMGGPGDIVLVQVFYQLPVGGAPLGFTLANSSANGNAVLVGTAVFRNEPYATN